MRPQHFGGWIRVISVGQEPYIDICSAPSLSTHKLVVYANVLDMSVMLLAITGTMMMVPVMLTPAYHYEVASPTSGRKLFYSIDSFNINLNLENKRYYIYLFESKWIFNIFIIITIIIHHHHHHYHYHVLSRAYVLLPAIHLNNF